MPNQNLSLMKRAQSFLRSISVANIVNHIALSHDCSHLNRAKSEAHRIYQDFFAKCTDGIAEEHASELETAGERILEIVQEVDSELDGRTSGGTWKA